MMSNNQRKEILINSILNMKKTTPTQLTQITKKGLASYFQASKTFGKKSGVTREALNTIREMFRIRKVESRILDYILENLDSMELSCVENAVANLNKLNSQTYVDYHSVLGEINAACVHKDESRVLKPKDGINSLLTNKGYGTMVLSLTERLSDIKSFLPYEDDFWRFIETYSRVVPTTAEGAVVMCGIVPILDENKNLFNFYTIVPKAVDYQTAMIAVDIYKRAHDLYMNRGYKYDQILKTSGTAMAESYREHLEEKAERLFK